MKKAEILKRMLGVATLAILFGTPGVHAESSSSGSSGQSGAAQDLSTKSSDTDLSGSPGSASSGASSSGSSSSGSSQSLSKADQQLIKDLDQANRAEIAASELALQKSEDKQVQEYAQKMIDDHTAANEKVQEFAEQKNVQLPTELDRKYKAEIVQLQKLQGDKFDKRYLSEVGRQDHRDASKLLAKIEKQAKDQDLKQLASSMKETIGEHLHMAQTLDRADAATKASGSSGGAASSGAAGGGKSLSKSDQILINDLAQTNLAEIAASKLALQKSEDKQVQEFAQKMIDDHTAAQEKLQQLAEKKGIQLPTEPDRAYQTEMNQMQALSGDKFDKRYLSEVGREDHRDATKMLSKIEKQAKDQDFKQLATEMKKTIGEHLHMAQTLDRGDAATKASGDSGTSGSSSQGK